MTSKILPRVSLLAVLVLGGCSSEKMFPEVTARLPGDAFGTVDGIGSAVSPAPGSTVVVIGNTISVTGNYADASKGVPAAGVLVMIDNKPFATRYGAPRPDIAKTLGNPKYLNIQFTAEIPAAAVGKGVHALKIRAIAADESGYFQSGPTWKIDVR